VRSGRGGLAPFAVGAYIAAAYFFTSSTSFANPAVTLARTLTDTFAGIAPSSVPGFVTFQVFGGALAAAAILALYPDARAIAPELVLPHAAGRAAADPSGGAP
jgi:glycerol uptake facilitator-like aquaporin